MGFAIIYFFSWHVLSQRRNTLRNLTVLSRVLLPTPQTNVSFSGKGFRQLLTTEVTNS